MPTKSQERQVQDLQLAHHITHSKAVAILLQPPNDGSRSLAWQCLLRVKIYLVLLSFFSLTISSGSGQEGDKGCQVPEEPWPTMAPVIYPSNLFYSLPSKNST